MIVKFYLLFLYFLISCVNCQFLSIQSYEQVGNRLYLTGVGLGANPDELMVKMGDIQYNDYMHGIGGEIIMEEVATKISILIKDGSKNKNLTLFNLVSNVFYDQVVLKPEIVSFSTTTIPTWSSGTITMFGNYFEAATSNNAIAVYQDNVSIRFILVPNGVKINLVINTLSGGGKSEFKVNIDGKESNPFNLNYDAPVITTVSKPRYYSNDLLTIDGDNFSYNSKDDTTVSLGGQLCTSIESFSKNRLVVKCNNNVAQTLSVLVNVNGLSVSSTTYYAPLQLKSLSVLSNGLLEISILYYSPQTSIAICNVEISQYCTVASESNDIAILHCDVPNTASIKSGTIFITRPVDSYSSIINLRPYISYFDQELNDISTEGSIVTANGKFLNQFDCSGTSDNFRVNYRGSNIESSLITFINSTKITFNLPSGTGSQNQLFFTANAYSEGIQSFNVKYSNPVIYSSNSNNNIVTINGNNFGQDKDLIGLWYMGQKISSSSITLTIPHKQLEFSFSLPPNTIKKTYNITVNDLSSPNYVEPKVISSTSLYYQQPGNITIEADHFQPDDVKVYVSNVECTNPLVLNLNSITCFYDASVKPDSLGRALNISLSSAGLTGSNEVFYYNDITHECKFNCSNHGTCNKKSAECLCFNGWEGLYCQLESSNGSTLPPPIIDDNGNTVVIGGRLNFTISILYLRENDIFGNQVKLLKLSDLNWENRTRINENQHYYKGVFKNGETLELDINYYKDATNYEFAGEEVAIPSNSMKYVIIISNYQFTSNTNNFEVIYNSKTKLYSSDGCNSIKTNEEYYSSSNNTNENINWFQVNTGDTIFQTKFTKRIFIDDKVRKSSTKILNYDDSIYNEFNQTIKGEGEDFYNKLISIETPNFGNYLKLDPSMSALLKPDSKCVSKKWKLPLILCLSIVGGVAILSILSLILYRKYRTSILSNDIVIKLKNFTNK